MLLMPVIDWQRFATDEAYVNDLIDRYRFENVEAALEAEARRINALGVVVDIQADRLDTIAEAYAKRGETLTAATKRAKARQAHAFAAKINRETLHGN